MIYPWIWRHLPGPTLLRLLIVALLLAAAVVLLFGVVFPWAENGLPFLKVTVDTGSTPTSP